MQKQCPHATPSHLPGVYPCPFPIHHVWSACMNRDASDSWVVGRRAEWRGVPPLSHDHFRANDHAQQGWQSRLGYAWYASCLIHGQAFPHPPHVGFMPPCLGTQAREPEQCVKGTPSLPLTLAPDDSERRPPHHPFDLRPRLCANGGPLPLGGSWVRTWHPPLLTRRLLHLAPAYPGVPSQPRTSPGAEGQRSDLPHPDCAPLRQARYAGRVRPPFPSCATHLSHTSTLLREPGDRGFPLGQHAPQRPDQRGIEKIP